MEPLSVAASAFGIVSLAIHLAESVQKLHRFWTSVRDLPEDIAGIIDDLQILQRILDEIGLEEQRLQTAGLLCQTSTEVLDKCRDNIRRLGALIRGFELEFPSCKYARTWVIVKIYFKKEKIDRFQKLLDRTMQYLLLEHIGFSRYDLCKSPLLDHG